MDKLKKPEMGLSIINLIGWGTTSAILYSQVKTLQAEVQELKKEVDVLTKTNRTVQILSKNDKQTAKNLISLRDNLSDNSTKIEDLDDLLMKIVQHIETKDGVSLVKKKKKTVNKKKPIARKKKVESESESDDEDDDDDDEDDDDDDEKDDMSRVKNARRK